MFLIFACAEYRDEESNVFLKTSGTFIDSRDNQEYRWVKIGNQIWWHLPSDAEWKQLEIELGMTQAQADDYIFPYFRGTDQGTQMKTAGGWHNNGNGTNTSGFSGLPGGYRFSNGNFCFIGSFGYWWSSTQGSAKYAWGRGLGFNTSLVCRNSNYKENGFSVRCIMN